MKVEFNQGVPEGCIEWLNTHVGKGNMIGIVDGDNYAWFYKSEVFIHKDMKRLILVT